MDIIKNDKEPITLQTANKYCKEDINVIIETEELTITPKEEEQVFEGLYNKVICEKAELEKPITLPFEFTASNVGKTIEIKLEGNNEFDFFNEKTVYIYVNESNNVKLEEKEIPYIPLNYIKTTGTQYIKTGIDIFNSDTWKIELDFTPTSLYNYNGIWAVENNNAKYESFFTSMKRQYTIYNTSSSNIDWITFTENVRVKYIDEFKNGVVTTYINGTSKRTYNISTAKTTSKLTLLKCSEDYSKIILYSAKLYKNNVLVRNFVPAKDFNNIPCLYDKISGTFFYNEGTGNFLYE